MGDSQTTGLRRGRCHTCNLEVQDPSIKYVYETVPEDKIRSTLWTAQVVGDNNISRVGDCELCQVQRQVPKSSRPQGECPAAYTAEGLAGQPPIIPQEDDGYETASATAGSLLWENLSDPTSSAISISEPGSAIVSRDYYLHDLRRIEKERGIEALNPARGPSINSPDICELEELFENDGSDIDEEVDRRIKQLERHRAIQAMERQHYP